MVVGGGAGGLNNKNVAGANVLLDFHRDFSIGEAAYIGSAQCGVKMLCNFSSKAGVGIASENHEVWMMVLHSVPVGMG